MDRRAILRKMVRMPYRLRYFLTHLALSALIVGSTVVLVVFVWYPPPFAQIEGIYSILLVMAGVDVGAGPLCTLVAASPRKSRAHLARDLAVIGCVQLGALLYGVHTAFAARPAYVVYSVGQFEIEHANELTAAALAKARGTPFSSTPLDGPRFVEARFPANQAEVERIILSAIRGGPDIKDMPRYYVAWPAAGTDAAQRAEPASRIPKTAQLRAAVDALLGKNGIPATDAAILPIHGRIDRGAVVLRKSNLAILGVVPTAM